jgi:two-component system KDP operon response regulator KdpE
VTESPRILVVDDDAQITRVLKTVLESQGYAVRTAGDGASARALVAEWKPDLVLTDLCMPHMNGGELCRRIRVVSRAPIIVLSVKDAERAKVDALDAGADDYMTKPFGTVEFRARVRAQLRRARMAPVPGGDAPLVLGPLTIDLARHTVSRDGRTVHLTRTEWLLLQTLVARAGRTMTHQQLFHAVWGSSEGDVQQYLRVYIAHLRRKLEADAYTPRHILTEPGVGYRFEIEPADHE